MISVGRLLLAAVIFGAIVGTAAFLCGISLSLWQWIVFLIVVSMANKLADAIAGNSFDRLWAKVEREFSHGC